MLWIAATLFLWSLARYLAGRYWPDSVGPVDGSGGVSTGSYPDCRTSEPSPADRPWTPPPLDTVVDLPDRGPTATGEPAGPATEPEPVQVEPVDLVDPVRVDVVPPAECTDSQWWDDRSCWGCDKACKFHKFHPYGHTNIGAEIRGACASRARADRESNGLYHGGFAPEPSKGDGMDKAGMWARLCEDCGTWIRAGSPSFSDGSAVVADSECPF